MGIVVEAAGTLSDLEEDIMEKISAFDYQRQRTKDCLPLTDYEKMLLAEFLKGLVR